MLVGVILMLLVTIQVQQQGKQVLLQLVVVAKHLVRANLMQQQLVIMHKLLAVVLLQLAVEHMQIPMKIH